MASTPVLRGPARGTPSAAELSLLRLLDPDVLLDPYPFYRTLREFEPVHWDPYTHSWVVTSYAEAQTVLHKYSADRTPTPEQLDRLGLSSMKPFAEVMVKHLLLNCCCINHVTLLASSAALLFE